MSTRERAPWAIAILLSIALLTAPALWNGFPFIFPDTGSYLTGPLQGTLNLGRSAVYGLFLDAGMPLAFWPNIVAQAALIVWLLTLTLRAHHLARPWLALGVVAILALGSSLPWVAGHLLPDVLFPAAVLALDLLIFRSGQIAAWERCALCGVVVCAVVSHMAAASLCVCLLATLWLLTRLARSAWPPTRFALAAAAVAAGIALIPVANGAIGGTFAFTPGGTSFLFGRILEDGIVARYLDDRCPDPPLQLCAFRGRMPASADGWLWDANSPLQTMNRRDVEAEERAIILATLTRYPLMHLSAAANEVAAQLLSFETEVSLTDNEPTLDAIARYRPQLMPQLLHARQQRGAIDAALLNQLHVPLAALAILWTAGALLLRRPWQSPSAGGAFCATLLLSIVLNAVICGVFSHAVDRYQSRLTPLALLAVMMLVFKQQRAGVEALPAPYRRGTS